MREKDKKTRKTQRKNLKRKEKKKEATFSRRNSCDQIGWSRICAFFFSFILKRVQEFFSVFSAFSPDKTFSGLLHFCCSNVNGLFMFMEIKTFRWNLFECAQHKLCGLGRTACKKVDLTIDVNQNWTIIYLHIETIVEWQNQKRH